MRWPLLAWPVMVASILAAGVVLAGLAAPLIDPPWEHPVGGAGSRHAAPAARPGAAGAPADEGTPEEHLAQASRLLGAHGTDGPGATKEGLLRAEAEVQAALRLGPVDPASAWRLLADVNGALASGFASAGLEEQGHRRRERAALRALLASAPGDGEARWRYATLVEDRDLRVEALTRAARLAPNDYRPRRALGEEWLAAGREDEGARLLVEAAERCTAEELGHQGPDIARLLRLHGREAEEARVRERLERLGY
jgi:surface antigen